MTAESAGRALAEIDGEGYTVRQTPPAYFFQESLRLQEEAQSDLKEFRLATSEYKVSGQKQKVRCALVLLRHGQSVYNKGKIFTGWAYPHASPLSLHPPSTWQVRSLRDGLIRMPHRA